MASATVFNLTEQPVQFTADGNRVPGRSTAVVADTQDPYYTAALTRGDLVVLSDGAETSGEVAAHPVPEPTPVAHDASALAAESSDIEESTDTQKKPSKAKEN